jgi:hypothetical protein
VAVSAHTPGPWHTDGVVVWASDDGGKSFDAPVCVIPSRNGDQLTVPAPRAPTCGLANADLIASAPDLRMVLVGGPWLVWSIEHNAWWGPNHCGYTPDRDRAGRYSVDQAREICRNANYRAGSDNEGTGLPSEVMVPSPQWLMLSDAAIAKAEGR